MIRHIVDAMPAAFYMAWSDTKARYRRSILGPLWLTLGTLIGVGGLALVWGVLLPSRGDILVPSLAVGLVLWQCIAGVIIESSTVFQKQSRRIKNFNLPLVFYLLHTLFQQLINLLHNIIVIFLIFLFFPPQWSAYQLWVVPGCILLFLNLSWISALFALLGARFTDFHLFVKAIMPILFFVTPVIFRPTDLGLKSHLAWMNPLTYLLTAVRAPLLGLPPQAFVYKTAIAMLGFGVIITAWLYQKKKHRIPFWI